jgi:signal transduction histidine kinase
MLLLHTLFPRRKDGMSRTKLVLGVALILGLGAVAALVALERRTDGSRAAQVSLANVSAQLTQLELIPLTAPALHGTSAQKTAALNVVFQARARAILNTIRHLEQGSPPAQLHQVNKPLNAALSAANTALAVWIPATGVDPAGSQVLNRQGITLGAALQSLDVANRAYGSRASVSQIEALSGSAAVFVILLVAFGFFYRRWETSRRKIDAQGASLRLALAELEAVQAERALLLERTVEVAEHERIRVAADLHDGPIQRLSAVTLGFDLLANRLKRGDHEQALTLVDDIRKSLAEETMSLRRLMTDLRPPILDARDLGAALHDCALHVFDGSSVRWDVDATHNEIHLAPELETVVYRVVREALVNVRKHAPAAYASVTLEPTGDVVRLAIADDGPGFDDKVPLGHTNGAHYGLIGMRERVESVGGTWSLATAPASGTRINVTLPRKLRTSAGRIEPAEIAA